MSIIALSEVCPITKPGVGFENPLNPQLFRGEVGVRSEVVLGTVPLDFAVWLPRAQTFSFVFLYEYLLLLT